MSPLIAKTIRRTAFVGVLAATAFLGYEFIQNPKTSTTVQTVKTSTVAKTAQTTAETGMRLISDKTDDARKTYDRLSVDRKIQDFQDKTKPIGQKITNVVSPRIGPSFQAVEAGERRMSWPALILVLVFGTVFVFMGRSSVGGRY